MDQIEILLHGIPGRSSHGYLGQASAALVDGETVVDVGSLGRRPVLEKSFGNVETDPEDVTDVLLTHVHFDHCDNVDLFPNATVHVYEPEYERLSNAETDWATPAGAKAALDACDVSLFEAGDVLNGLEAVPTPGHTEHHVAFVAEGSDGLTYGFTGDAVKNTRELSTMNPMVLYDKDAAVETLERMRDRLDFVVAGHDTPFHVVDGDPVAAVDVDFGVNLQFSPASATTAELTSNRSELKPLPDVVTDATARQEFH